MYVVTPSTTTVVVGIRSLLYPSDFGGCKSIPLPQIQSPTVVVNDSILIPLNQFPCTTSNLSVIGFIPQIDAHNVAIRSVLTDTDLMKGNEFIKKVKALGKRTNIAVRVDEKRGKGSHVTLYYGAEYTIVRNPKDENISRHA